jgi:hypothetical protein
VPLWWHVDTIGEYRRVTDMHTVGRDLVSAKPTTPGFARSRERVGAFRASGQSKTAWCKANGVGFRSLTMWRRRFQPVSAVAMQASAAVPSPRVPVSIEEPVMRPESGSLVVRVDVAPIDQGGGNG